MAGRTSKRWRNGMSGAASAGGRRPARSSGAGDHGRGVVVELGPGPVDAERRQREDAVAAVLREPGRHRGEAAPGSLDRDRDLARALHRRAQVVERQRPRAPRRVVDLGQHRPQDDGGEVAAVRARARSTTPGRSTRRTGPDRRRTTAVSVAKRDTSGNLPMSTVAPCRRR